MYALLFPVNYISMTPEIHSLIPYRTSGSLHLNLDFILEHW